MEKETDPQASLMNMMKKLYQEGDADIKKTIAQAWVNFNLKINNNNDSKKIKMIKRNPLQEIISR